LDLSITRIPKVVDLTAWYLATAPVDNLRDGKRALRLAEKAVDFTDGLEPLYLETLAAAFAETGDPEKAIETQQKALNLAISYDYDEPTKNELKARLESFKNKKPWRLN
jgi:tetratricopeptide (TPR) repeat protein